ncbi:hypothetical protein Ahy_B02g058681 [Arachis hypogaea]|uniref:Uncharacterized protein n=1 Tax=Arachis hypogaea TaxID=3818 RepID=A0A445AF46_ARAHY|nr:hypothetical protein Ahy_B02g058681 [Arachis hypogaea]
MLGVKQLEKLFCRIPISVLRDDVKYDSFVIGSDKDLQVLPHCRCSNQNPQSSGHPGFSSSMPVGASSVAPVIASEAVLVASLSFAFNLNCSGDAGVGETGPLGEVAFATPDSPATVLVFGEVGVPDGVEDALHDDDDDDDDVEFATIADDTYQETTDLRLSCPSTSENLCSRQHEVYPEPHQTTATPDLPDATQ